jgi:hypothetical protein
MNYHADVKGKKNNASIFQANSYLINDWGGLLLWVHDQE